MFVCFEVCFPFLPIGQLEKIFYGKCHIIIFSSNSPTLYVGEHLHGLYALPSFVDQNTVTIGPAQTGILLLEGPSHLQSHHQDAALNYHGSSSSSSSSSSSQLPLPGHNVRLSQSPNHIDIPLTFQSLPKEKDDITAPAVVLGKLYLLQAI
jgi:hypothetical protein